MRHDILSRVLLLVCCCSAATVMADDTTIAKELASRLRQAKTDGDLKDFRIGVKVEDGVVWLSGNVKDENQRQRALDVARRIAGVQMVVNDLACEAEPLTAPGQNSTGIADASTNVRARHVAHPRSSPPQPDLFLAPQLDEDQLAPVSVAAAPPLPPGAMVLVPGYSAVPAYPVQPVAQHVMAQPASRPRARSTPTRSAGPKPVPVARTKPARLVNYHTDCPPYQDGMSPGTIQGGPIHDGMSYDGMSYDGQYGDGYGDGYGGAYGGGGYGGYGGGYGVPVPEYGAGGASGSMYDNPQMPGYAWPSYASYPNYAAVTYPRQYSPMAWPYIGPFYPYPQVPLGWRKVSLEWDDGWWMLDFKSK